MKMINNYLTSNKTNPSDHLATEENTNEQLPASNDFNFEHLLSINHKWERQQPNP